MKKKLSKWSKKLEQLVVYNTNGPMVLSRKKPIQSWQQVKNVIANKVIKLKIQLKRKDHLESEKKIQTRKKRYCEACVCDRKHLFQFHVFSYHTNFPYMEKLWFWINERQYFEQKFVSLIQMFTKIGNISEKTLLDCMQFFRKFELNSEHKRKIVQVKNREDEADLTILICTFATRS